VTTYTYSATVVWDRLGTSVRFAGGIRSVSVTDPATGLVPANLQQNGVAVLWLTADAHGRCDGFTCDVPGVVVDFGAGAEALYANEVPGLAIAAGAVNGAAIDARMKWAPSTAYTLGQQIINPTADVVKANVGHTSAAAYATDVAKWDLSTTQTTANNAVPKASARVRSAVLTNGTDQTATLNAEITALATFGGGTIELPGSASAIKCNGTINLANGVTLAGAGTNRWANATMFDFTALAIGSSPFNINANNDVTLRDFSITGWTAGGTKSVILAWNSCQRLTLKNLWVSAVTTGAGIDLGTTGYVLESSVEGCTVTGMATGFKVGAASTSINLRNCYAMACTGSGYTILGTYIVLTACASDLNPVHGYLLQNCKAIALVGCGAESNGLTAYNLVGVDGVTLIGCRSHLSNTTATAGWMSFVGLNSLSEYVTVIGCVDSSPNAASTASIGNSSGGATSKNVTLMNNDLPLGVKAAQASHSLTATSTTTAPAAGGAGALPATPLGYYSVTINGTARQVAYY
jgi:hypothetical protein